MMAVCLCVGAGVIYQKLKFTIKSLLVKIANISEEMDKYIN